MMTKAQIGAVGAFREMMLNKAMVAAALTAYFILCFKSVKRSDLISVLLSCFCCKNRQQSFECLVDRFLLELTFPYYVNFPASLLKFANLAFIAFLVKFKLDRPIFHIAFRHGRFAVGASVPKATIDEDGDFLSRPRDIGAARNFPMQAIPCKSSLAKLFSNEELGFRIVSLVRLHHLGRYR